MIRRLARAAMPITVAWLVAALHGATTAGAGEPRLRAELSPTEITVGDRVELLVELRLPPDVPPRAVNWPTWETRLGEAEILDTSPIEGTEDGRAHVLRQRLTLTLFRAGSFTLPPIEIGLTRDGSESTLTSAAGTVEVLSVLPEGDEPPEPRPPSPPRPLDLGERFWWLVAALLALCLAGVAWLVRRARDDELAGGRPRLAPLEELSRAVAELRQESDLVAVHAGTSLALRRYLGRQLAFAAPESTTTEVDRALRRRRLDSDLVRRTITLLTACDMVKFARREVDEAEARGRIDAVEGLAERIEAWLRPAPEADSSETPLAEAS